MPNAARASEPQALSAGFFIDGDFRVPNVGRRRKWAKTRATNLLREQGIEITEAGLAAASDRAAYHPRNQKLYASTIGIRDDEGNTYCVGCWWCEGDWTEVHTLYLGEPRVTA